MIKYSELMPDLRFEGESEFCQKILGTLKLSDPQIEQLYQPMMAAVEDNRLLEAVAFIKGARKLMICGDYDCDGVTSTAIAMMLAKKLGIEAGYYIPNRMTEGYGASRNILEMAHRKGYDRVMMIDNGVKAFEALDFAKSVGMPVCIVDHHTYDAMPEVAVFVHPNVLPESCEAMCAAGLMALIAEANSLADETILALGCVGTIGDVMPLWKKNRDLVIRGLKSLNELRYPPLVALLQRQNGVIDATTVAFQIVPKLNAVGRMADRVNVNTLIPYLMSDDSQLIQRYAAQILEVNNVRKSLGQDLKQLALNMLDESPVNVLVDDRFHEGLLGIVANQITSITKKPSLIFQKVEEGYKGSARSQTISLNSLFSKMDASYFVAMGGHDFAYGMTIHEEHFEQFTQEVKSLSLTMESVKVDEAVVLMNQPLTRPMIQSLAHFEPFGTGFALPLFAIECPEDFSVYAIGDVGFRLSFKNFWLKSAVVFNPAVSFDPLNAPQFLIGRFADHPQYGLSFTIESVIS